LRVWIAQQTAQWATLTLSGPNARRVLSGLRLDLDLGTAAFPHMRIHATRFEGFEVRVRRASFTGELSFELDVPAECAGALWDRLLELGRAFDIMPLGMEALDRLRIEKGFLEVGVDTDGETSPLDVGWATAVARKSEDFIGRRSLARSAFQAPGRLQLVGLVPLDLGLHIPVGAHAIAAGGEIEGHVTSSCVSPHVGRSVALAMIRSGATRKGETLTLDIEGRHFPATIVDTGFFDPGGERLRG
jgi:sarcosine oxidase subunit alpha